MKTKDFSYLDVTGLATQFLEIQIDYDGGPSPVYVGYSLVAGAGDDAPLWYIVKLEYSGTSLIRQRIGSLGRQWTYVWTDRATYFV